MPVYGILRRNEITVYLSDEEMEIVKEMASNEGLSLSEYARGELICGACLELNSKAWKLTYNNASRRAKEWLHRKMKLKGGVVKTIL